ncbi:Short-chain dehydrogenase/reductase SDR [Lasiodiplodia theobromae]|uniref:Nad-dependent 15-hydroxyprostaglandin dehydrogenase n=1 Tax=Lasiodiplodia theobromae TaxID=45133 RepID=UPI0015C2FB37|nr:Nad-dependent 15-hydroxyprostaglandin dehydrogenase [Lasiodiplodia theobromae]KAF4542659.1 Nad-dependent 15-hydroxyprostaglandin dehydrogenase [Lasiodiplodia theobromae]KAF9640779.1 Short-chain dehydrogenase/reductase SDR [Lasiodiplodia theobromae]
MAAAPTSAPLPFSVSGKTAIVTGAGSGINLAFARLLLSRNCNVVFADLSLRPEAQALVDEYSTPSAESPRALFVKTDVSSWPALRQLFTATLAAFGDFDIVCPGAGVYEPHWSNFWHPPGCSAAARDDVDGGRYALLDINVTHPIRATQLALSLWLHPAPAASDSDPSATKQPVKASPLNPKRVVHISSVAGQVPNFNAPLYAASKHAISGFVRCLAPLEPTAGVRVNAVAPGIIRTPLWTEHPEKLAFINQETDGWATAEEVAEAMLRCVEEPALVGGSILEVGKDNTRTVECFNDPGPDRDPKKGLIVSNGAKGTEEIWGWLGDEAVWRLKDNS